MKYKELFKLWMNERTNAALQLIPTDFYISTEGDLTKIYQTSQDSSWTELSNQIIQRMEFLYKDIAKIRLAKILDMIMHEEPIEEKFLAWSERRLIKDLQRSIATLGILESTKLSLDVQNLSLANNVLENAETDLIQDDNSTEKAIESFENNLIRIISDIESFIGLDEKEYGPFIANDIVNLPVENAKALISKGLAKYIDINLNSFPTNNR